MNIHTGTCIRPQAKGCHLHQAGINPDHHGRRSGLGEAIQLGGFIPIDEVIDLLPFRIRTLRKWAKKGTFASCFKRMYIGPCGNSILFINVAILASRFEELAESTFVEDSVKGPSADPSLNDISDLNELAKLVVGEKHN
jgi:hypothetical protein